MPRRRMVDGSRRPARADQGPVHPGARSPLRPAAQDRRTRRLARTRPADRARDRGPGRHGPPARAGARRARARSCSTASTSGTASSRQSGASFSTTAGRARRRRPPGPEGAAMLRELLAPSVSLRVPMAEQILDEEVALIQLTSEQSLALARLGRNRRLVVYGCAGSGKTMLAVEHAKRLARTGEGGAVRLLQPRARSSTCGGPNAGPTSRSSRSTACAPTSRTRPRSSCRSTRPARRRRSTSTTSYPTR